MADEGDLLQSHPSLLPCAPRRRFKMSHQILWPARAFSTLWLWNGSANTSHFNIVILWKWVAISWLASCRMPILHKTWKAWRLQVPMKYVIPEHSPQNFLTRTWTHYKFSVLSLLVCWLEVSYFFTVCSSVNGRSLEANRKSPKNVSALFCRPRSVFNPIFMVLSAAKRRKLGSQQKIKGEFFGRRLKALHNG